MFYKKIIMGIVVTFFLGLSVTYALDHVIFCPPLLDCRSLSDTCNFSTTSEAWNGSTAKRMPLEEFSPHGLYTFESAEILPSRAFCFYKNIPSSGAVLYSYGPLKKSENGSWNENICKSRSPQKCGFLGK